MAIEKRTDGKYEVTCRNEAGNSMFAVRDSEPLAEAFFIRHARAVSCAKVPSLSYRGLCEWYGLVLADRGVASAGLTVQTLRIHTFPSWAGLKIGEVTLANLFSLRSQMLEAGYAVPTANHVLKLVRYMYHLAHCEGRIGTNPVSPEMSRPDGPVRARRLGFNTNMAPVRTPDEAGYQLLRRVAPPHLRVAFDLIEDWVRFSEIRALPLDCIDLARRTVLIRRAHTTTGLKEYPEHEWRVLALSPRTVASIRRLRFELAHGPSGMGKGREGLLLPIAITHVHPMELAQLHAIDGDFRPDDLYCRIVVRGIAKGMTAVEIGARSGRLPRGITRRFHVAFRRRAARALLGPMNANLARLLA